MTQNTLKWILGAILLDFALLFIWWYLDLTFLSITLWETIYIIFIAIIFGVRYFMLNRKEKQKIEKEKVKELSTEKAEEELLKIAKREGMLLKDLTLGMEIIQPGSEEQEPSSFQYLQGLDNIDDEYKLIILNINTLNYTIERANYKIKPDRIKDLCKSAAKSKTDIRIETSTYLDPVLQVPVTKRTPVPLYQKRTVIAEPKISE